MIILKKSVINTIFSIVSHLIRHCSQLFINDTLGFFIEGVVLLRSNGSCLGQIEHRQLCSGETLQSHIYMDWRLVGGIKSLYLRQEIVMVMLLTVIFIGGIFTIAFVEMLLMCTAGMVLKSDFARPPVNIREEECLISYVDSEVTGRHDSL